MGGGPDTRCEPSTLPRCVAGCPVGCRSSPPDTGPRTFGIATGRQRWGRQEDRSCRAGPTPRRQIGTGRPGLSRRHETCFLRVDGWPGCGGTRSRAAGLGPLLVRPPPPGPGCKHRFHPVARHFRGLKDRLRPSCAIESLRQEPRHAWSPALPARRSAGVVQLRRSHGTPCGLNGGCRRVRPSLKNR